MGLDVRFLCAQVQCGVWTPCDGDVDPTSLTNCIAKKAKEHGALFKLNREVVAIRHRPGGGFVVQARTGGATGEVEELEADVLINAAGLWSKQITQMVDESLVAHHKCFVIEHQYAITEEVPAIQALAAKGQRIPVIRDLKGSSYIRQERTGLLVGPYEADCEVRNYDDGRGTWVTGPPSDWGPLPTRITHVMSAALQAWFDPYPQCWSRA